MGRLSWVRGFILWIPFRMQARPIHRTGRDEGIYARAAFKILDHGRRRDLLDQLAEKRCLISFFSFFFFFFFSLSFLPDSGTVLSYSSVQPLETRSFSLVLSISFIEDRTINSGRNLDPRRGSSRFCRSTRSRAFLPRFLNLHFSTRHEESMSTARTLIDSIHRSRHARTHRILHSRRSYVRFLDNYRVQTKSYTLAARFLGNENITRACFPRRFVSWRGEGAPRIANVRRRRSTSPCPIETTLVPLAFSHWASGE